MAIATVLRAALGLAPDEASVRERVARLGRHLPPSLEEFDADAWIAWAMAGLALFSGPSPTVRTAQIEAKRIILALAMLDADGNISVASRAIGSSRRSLREGLQVLGLYPWADVTDALSSDDAPRNSARWAKMPSSATGRDAQDPDRLGEAVDDTESDSTPKRGGDE